MKNSQAMTRSALIVLELMPSLIRSTLLDDSDFIEEC